MTYVERYGSEIVNVNVSGRLKLPLEMLGMAMMIDGEEYRMHPIGGGLVAASSYVPDNVSVPMGLTIGTNTHVLTDQGMVGQFYIAGDFANPNQVSRKIDEHGLKLLEEQRKLGVIGRIEEIDRNKRLAEAAALLDSFALFTA